MSGQQTGKARQNETPAWPWLVVAIAGGVITVSAFFLMCMLCGGVAIFFGEGAAATKPSAVTISDPAETRSEMAVPREAPQISGLLVAPFSADEAHGARQAWADRLHIESSLTNTLGMQFVLVPPGQFQMGSPPSERGHESSEALHWVRLTRPFYMGTTEVTEGVFRQFKATSGYQTESMPQFDPDMPGPRLDYRSPEMDNVPVVVSWKDATAFAAWLSEHEGVQYRLPTEAEWEYACRAGTTTSFCCGDDIESLHLFANVRDASYRRIVPGGRLPTIPGDDGFYATAPVGSLRANSFGLFDVHGNVSEWCQDWYSATYYTSLGSGVADDPQGPIASGNSHVFRGGSFIGGPASCRSAHRGYFARPPLYLSECQGFRLVRNVQP